MANRYENASPKDETWYQIKCPLCGFIDATQNKYKWKCPECDVKVKKVVKVETKPEKPVQATNQAINETKAIQEAPRQQIENKEFLEAFHRVLGTKPAEPAMVKSEFKVGAFQCKIVSTKKN